MSSERAKLALADGTVFHGYAVGAVGETSGEVVFNTSMTGYQEITTDPSYCNQMLTFTYPHIGNVGANAEDVESAAVQVSGVIVRELSRHYSNFRAEQSFDEYLKDNSVVGIGGIDTRKLVVHLRDNGSQMGIISSLEASDAELVERARLLPSMEGQNLVAQVSTKEPYDWKQGPFELGKGFREYTDSELKGRPLVVAIDFGVKYNILRRLIESGFRVKVAPASYTAEQILALGPDAVFLSNGPGDPAAVEDGIQTVRELVGKKPMFGICLGHQILGLALGAPTFKLKFGHRGGNHPVRNERTGKIEITVQNHGFATDAARVPPSLCVSHINLNDRTVEGFRIPDAKAFSIQYHPESSPGPHDAKYLFEEFYQLALQ